MKILIYSANFAPEPTGIGKYSGDMAWWLAVQLPFISLIVKEYPWEASVSQWETLLQGTLQDQQLHPFSKFPACFRQQADLLKSERRVQSDRGDIHSTDAGNHRVTAFRLALRDQLSQEHLADAVADTIGAHVD